MTPYRLPANGEWYTSFSEFSPVVKTTPTDRYRILITAGDVFRYSPDLPFLATKHDGSVAYQLTGKCTYLRLPQITQMISLSSPPLEHIMHYYRDMLPNNNHSSHATVQ